MEKKLGLVEGLPNTIFFDSFLWYSDFLLVPLPFCGLCSRFSVGLNSNTMHVPLHVWSQE